MSGEQGRCSTCTFGRCLKCDKLFTSCESLLLIAHHTIFLQHLCLHQSSLMYCCASSHESVCNQLRTWLSAVAVHIAWDQSGSTQVQYPAGSACQRPASWCEEVMRKPVPVPYQAALGALPCFQAPLGLLTFLCIRLQGSLASGAATAPERRASVVELLGQAAYMLHASINCCSADRSHRPASS